MNKLAIASVIALAPLLGACELFDSPEKRCMLGEYIYFKTKDRGGAAERRAADAVYAELKTRCAAVGIILQ